MSNWQLVKLRTTTTKVGSGATPRGGKDSYKSAGVPLIRSQNVHFDGFRDDGLAFLDGDQAEALKSVEVHAEDVLLNITGASIGRVTTAPTRMSGARVNQHVCIIRPKPELRPSFLSWYLASPNIQHFIFDIQTGVTRQALTKEQILAFDVPLPPVDIQDKIVAEIEKQFSRLDESVTALKRIQANIKRYKAAVLKAAVEGKLTEQWRKEHPDVEPANQLLKRILAERRAKWEAEELAKMKAKGIKPKDDSWKKKYKEPAGPDTANLPELPDGWVWATVDQLSVVVRGASPRPAGDPKYFGGDVPWITVGEITKDENKYLDSVSSFVTEEGKKASRYIQQGNLLLTNSGATLGVPKILKIAGCINDGSVALLDLDEPLKSHLYYLLKGMTEQLRKINQGAAQPNLNTDIVRNILVPLPPLKEQAIISEEIDRRLSVTEELETTIEINLKRAERLRQTMLKRFFGG